MNIPCPFDPNSLTSIAAAKSMSFKTKSEQVKGILRCLRDVENGLTADGIQAITGVRIDSIRPRLSFLSRKGAVVKTDETRPTRSGKQASIWKFVGVPPEIIL
jgi:hypothetical protein